MTRPACFVQDIRTAVPTRVLRAGEAADVMRQTCRSPRTARLLRRIVRLTGIESRHLAALDHQDGDDIAARLYQPAGVQPHGPAMGRREALFAGAADPLVAAALADLPRDALRAVRTLVTCSCTHASAPGLERPVFAHAPLSTDVARWNLGFMGCSAGLAALRLAQATAAQGAALVVACELSSLHFQYSDDLDQITANLLFADGAAALLLGPRPSAARVVDAVSIALPEQAGQMTWFADDHGLRLHLSPDLPETLAAHLPAVIADLLARHGLRQADVAHWLVHPGGPQVLDSVAACLDLSDDALDLSRAVLRTYGNMSSPTILFILRDLLRTEPRGWCVALAFGPGLTVEAVLLELGDGEGVRA